MKKLYIPPQAREISNKEEKADVSKSKPSSKGEVSTRGEQHRGEARSGDQSAKVANNKKFPNRASWDRGGGSSLYPYWNSKSLPHEYRSHTPRENKLPSREDRSKSPQKTWEDIDQLLY